MFGICIYLFDSFEKCIMEEMWFDGLQKIKMFFWVVFLN